jgi:hypothetical protein
MDDEVHRASGGRSSDILRLIRKWLKAGVSDDGQWIGDETGYAAGSRNAASTPPSASAPFVATLVDVTGLIIYFTVAKIILTGTLL